MKIKNNQWISVKDRLPKKDGMYLCYTKSPIGSYVNIYYYRARKAGRYGKGFYFLLDSEYGDVEVRYVTHWMKLPEPPKGE